MRLKPASNGNEGRRADTAHLSRVGLVRPTVSGVATAGATVLVLGFATLLLVVPSVFYLTPMPEDADGVTLCLPGVGPVLRVREGLPPDQEELAFIHEGVHAEQCRTYGALWYARQASSPRGRLTLEAPALCAEVAVLAGRGGDEERLIDSAVAALVTDYLEDDPVPGWEVIAAMQRTCGAALATGDGPDR
jgi:hypothetical protein